jgi:hypothetical protein
LSTQHSDAAKRASDAVNLHLAALGFGAFKKWVAVRLLDGSSDGVLYDTRREAVRHQLDEKLCAYLCLPPTQLTPCSAEAFLKFTRDAYRSGFRLTDPDHRTGGPELVKRLTTRDQRRQANALPAAFRR